MAHPPLLVVVRAVQTMLLTWLSFASHDYQAKIYPVPIRTRAVGFVYSWSRFSAIFTGSWSRSSLRVPACRAYSC